MAATLSRRSVFKVLAGVVAVASGGKAQYGYAPSLAYPALKVGNINNLRDGQAVYFNYPDGSAQGVLVKLGQRAIGGVGRGRDIVAFSAACTHMGCGVQFKGGRFVYPCHYSMFDPAKAGQCYQGLASTPLPQIRLRVAQNGDLLAQGVVGLIWGRARNI